MRIGVIGVGKMGRQRISDLLALGERDILIHDTDYERQWKAGIDPCIRACSDLDVLWAKEPKAVLICTPPDSHLAYLQAACDHGVRAIFCEKPLALTAPTPALLAALAERVTMVGANLRYADRFATLKSWLPKDEPQNGTFAELRAHYHLPTVRSNYLSSYVATTGALFDVGWHMADLAVDWLGPARLVDSAINSAESIGLPETDGRARLVLAHERGGISRIDVDFTRQWYQLEASVTLADDTTATATYHQALGPEMYRGELEHFLACTREGKATVNPVERAVEVLKLLLEAKATRLCEQ